MVLELRVWGPAFGLPSIDAECIAAVAYCQSVVPTGQWALIADHDPSIGATESLPLLYDDGVATAAGFEDIVAYLRNHPAVMLDSDGDLTKQQQTDRTAFISFFQSSAAPLIDLSLYVSAENYNTVTSSAYTAILPWYANHTVPPKRRDIARSRTAHIGLSSLDIDTTLDEASTFGRGMPSSDYEAAKRAAGIPTTNQPGTLSMGRGKGLGGFLGGPLYAAQFRLDALSNELLEPLSDLLGKHSFAFGGDQPSSLDCLVFGYLSLIFYPVLPQAWLRETILTKHSRIASYISRLRHQFCLDEEINPANVWAVATGAAEAEQDSSLPWRSRSYPRSQGALAGARELLGNIPVLSSFMQRSVVVLPKPISASERTRSNLPNPLFVNALLGATTAITVGLAAVAIRHRRNPREGDLIFWALTPSSGFGEAGELLSVLANQLPYSRF